MVSIYFAGERRRVLSLLVIGLAVALTSAAPAAERKIDFNRDVRPILSDNCFYCHGPDEKQRKGDLRLDTKEGLQQAQREILTRITAPDADERMPPVKSGKELSPAQIETLKQWSAQGASWSSHWAFTAPVRPPLPQIPNPQTRSWIRNPIDNFILARMTPEGLSPSVEADKVTLIRRLSLDLTGLPPTPAEVDAFLNDKSPRAYEQLVDRLLASPRYGEKMAWRWLEAARYSDTNGYQTDAGRDMWRWRDWVIDAFNRNLPFDRFTVEQLAGDMLPGATLEQRIATGFNRNHRGNSEGGIVPEEYAVEYVADRVETTGTVWLGLTLTCCRCHDHKFDPLSQQEFYQLFAYFNNVPEKGRAVKFGNSPPFIKAPTAEQERELQALDAKLRDAEQTVAALEEKRIAAQQKWEISVNAKSLPEAPAAAGQVALFSFDREETLVPQGGAAKLVPGRQGQGVELGEGRFLEAGDIANFGFDDRFTVACWVHPRSRKGTVLSRTQDVAEGDGYTVQLVDGKLQVHLTKRWLDDALRVETVAEVPVDQWTHVTVTYDATRGAAGTKVYLNGAASATRVLLDELNQSFASKEPFRIGAGGGSDARFQGLIDDVRIYQRVLEPAEIRILAVAESPAEILAVPREKRSPAATEKLQAYFLATAAPEEIQSAHTALQELRQQREKLWDSISTIMVMEEMSQPRQAFILNRGEYDKRGKEVAAGVPAVFPPLPANLPNNRLGFAQWLVDPKHPLTARVAVNRIWQMHFGVGLVKTSEDFGTQGAFPSHPELLDWLAVEFATDWDLKRLHKLIVMSATYRQTSRVTPELRARDPENKLYTRYPRLRLSADVLRDQALFVSGLLVEKRGGPSVKPYQPAGLWNELSGAGDYAPDSGENLYRRSLYTYWKRTSPPPVLATFDAAGRETCWVRENRTNTPLQALTLLNETAYVEAARMLAQRVLLETTETDARLTLAMRLVTGRPPSPAEAHLLRANLDFQLAEFRENPTAAKKLLASGEAPVNQKLDAVELAAYATVCNLLLNLDEVVTKE